jgi:hypothetical protein
MTSANKEKEYKYFITECEQYLSKKNLALPIESQDSLVA